MAKLRVTPAARNDIIGIAEYVARQSGSSTAARRLYQHLTERLRTLAAQPATMGRPRPELRADLRSVTFKTYVIFLRYVGDTLEIVNVLEGHRDIGAFYSDD